MTIIHVVLDVHYQQVIRNSFLKIKLFINNILVQSSDFNHKHTELSLGINESFDLYQQQQIPEDYLDRSMFIDKQQSICFPIDNIQDLMPYSVRKRFFLVFLLNQIISSHYRSIFKIHLNHHSIKILRFY